MWKYEKRLQFPVNIKEPNARMAQFIMSQYGGPDGEMGASMRYLSQRYAMPYKECKGTLTDIGTEEWGREGCEAARLRGDVRQGEGHGAVLFYKAGDPDEPFLSGLVKQRALVPDL